MTKFSSFVKSQYLIQVLLLALFSFLLNACSPESKAKFSSLGSSVLNSVGINVSESNLTNFVDFGEQLQKASRGLSEEQEYYLGRAVSATILKQYKVSKSGQQNRYINKVGRVLAGYSPRPETFAGYHFAILDKAEINALSAPGGFVFVTKGFVTKLKNEDQLAAVLAHEIAHVALGHGTAAISQANLTSALTTLGKDAASSYAGNSMALELLGPFTDSVNEIAETLLRKGYSRSQEYEADLLAAQILKNSGYQAGAMLNVLDTLAAQSGQSGGWTDTHPKPEKRKDELEDEYSDLAVDSADTAYQYRKARFLQNIN